MNLKLRFALLFSLLVALILIVSSVLIYLFYAEFRKDEFYLRLQQKAITTYSLLVDIKQIDKRILQLIDRNTLNELRNEKILIFNRMGKLIYSSQDEIPITYSPELVRQIEHIKKISFSENDYETLGLYYGERGKEAIIIASAYDLYGRRKLSNLQFTLIFVTLGGISLSGLLSYFYVQEVFRPVHLLNTQIKGISETNLGERVPIKTQHGELAELAMDFNHMLDRIEQAFRLQRSFIQHASHELRTPLSNLIVQTEAALSRDYDAVQYRKLLLSLNEDHKNLSSLVDALLLLSKYESMGHIHPSLHRVDEILDKAIEEAAISYPDYQVKLDYKTIPENESELEIPCNDILLRIAFGNLIRNACKYSESKSLEILIENDTNEVRVQFLNNGDIIGPDEQFNLYMPFFRGENAMKKSGFGLGLSIVKRILDLHHAEIQYSVTNSGLNLFEVKLLR